MFYMEHEERNVRRVGNIQKTFEIMSHHEICHTKNFSLSRQRARPVIYLKALRKQYAINEI